MLLTIVFSQNVTTWIAFEFLEKKDGNKVRGAFEKNICKVSKTYEKNTQKTFSEKKYHKSRKQPAVVFQEKTVDFFSSIFWSREQYSVFVFDFPQPSEEKIQNYFGYFCIYCFSNQSTVFHRSQAVVCTYNFELFFERLKIYFKTSK